MATIRLVPSTYSLSNSTYLSVSNASNMYTNTDSTNYATISNSQSGTTSYYIYIKGFDFSSIPSGAVVSSWTVKLKASQSGGSTSTSYSPKLCNNTSQITSTCSAITTSTQTLTFTGVSLDWDTVVGYGSNFGVRINCRRNNRNTAASFNIYGVEILVEYTVPNPRTITTTLTGNGTIDPSGTHVMYDGDEYVLTIVPTNSSDSVSATKNGSAITLTHHEAGTQTINATAESLETGFSGGSNMNFYTSSSSTGHNFNYAIGHTAESPGSTSSGSGSWTYVKEGSGSTSNTGYADFSFDFSEIPVDATINSVTVKCYGAQEDSSQSTGHADITLYSGSTQKGSTQEFTSSTNSIITLSNVGTWTAAELHEAKLRFAVGYYGGHIFGITWTVSYNAPEYYSYSYEIDGDATIAVVIGGSAETDTLYIKVNGSYVAVSAVYKKVNGSWVAQSNLRTLFDTGTNYVKAN